MAINLKAPETKELRPRITVLGVGGAGGNAVNNMVAAKLEGVDFVVANTDAQALAQSKAERKIQLGAQTTEGLGAGAQPDVGRAGAEESLDEILEQLGGSHMVFITAGMGGGTGTGAAPVIARAVRELGILTVGVVTKPFAFEGDKRMRIAERGILELQQYVHTLIVIPNQNLFRVANDRTTFAQAFAMADEVLHSACAASPTDRDAGPDQSRFRRHQGGDLRDGQGDDGHWRGPRARIARRRRRDGDLQPAARRGVDEGRARRAHQHHRRSRSHAVRGRAGRRTACAPRVDPDANIIFGNTILDDMEGRIRVSVVATGIDRDGYAFAEECRAAAAQSQARAAARGVESGNAGGGRGHRQSGDPSARGAGGGDECRAASGDRRRTGIRRKRTTSSAAPMRRLSTIRSRSPSGRNRFACSRRRSPNQSAAAGELLGRKKPREEMRTEPVAPLPQRQAVQPRASAQPLTRPQPKTQRTAPQNGAQDLFRRPEAGRAVRNPGLPAPSDELIRTRANRQASSAREGPVSFRQAHR